MKRVVLLSAVLASLLSLCAVVSATGQAQGMGLDAVCCDKGGEGEWCPDAYPVCFNSGVDCDPRSDWPGVQGYCVKDKEQD